MTIETHNLVNLDTDALIKAVHNDFGLDVIGLEKITKGYSSQVYRAMLGDQDVFIRINEDSNVFEVEEVGYRIFEEKGVPVPKIIAYNPNPTSIGYPTVIMTAAVGKTFGEANLSQQDKDIIYEKLGDLLKKINETKLEGFGQLKVENGNLVGQFSNWKEYCESQNERHNRALSFCLESGFVTNEEAEKIKNIYKEISLLDIGKASLLHRDIHRGHFFVTGPEVTGIIDLGSIMAGDPRYDVAMALVFQDENQQEHFKKGYRDALANDPLVNKYMITIFIRKLFFRRKREIPGDVNILLSPLKNSLGKLS